jgi:hypothetical protein
MMDSELEEGGGALAGLDQQDSGVGSRDRDGDPGKSGTRAQIGYEPIRSAHGHQGSKRVQDMSFPDAPAVSPGDQAHRNGLGLEKRLVPPEAIALILREGLNQ